MRKLAPDTTSGEELEWELENSVLVGDEEDDDFNGFLLQVARVWCVRAVDMIGSRKKVVWK